MREGGDGYEKKEKPKKEVKILEKVLLSENNE